jgi:hypothetical protein
MRLDSNILPWVGSIGLPAVMRTERAIQNAQAAVQDLPCAESVGDMVADICLHALIGGAIGLVFQIIFHVGKYFVAKKAKALSGGKDNE